MAKKKYSEKEIKNVLEWLKDRHPEKATRERAIKMLETTGSFMKLLVEKVVEDRKSGKLRKQLKN